MTAEELREVRHMLGLSQSKMAAKIGLKTRGYQYLEAGKYKITRSLEGRVQNAIASSNCAMAFSDQNNNPNHNR